MHRRGAGRRRGEGDRRPPATWAAGLGRDRAAADGTFTGEGSDELFGAMDEIQSSFESRASARPTSPTRWRRSPRPPRSQRNGRPSHRPQAMSNPSAGVASIPEELDEWTMANSVVAAYLGDVCGRPDDGRRAAGGRPAQGRGRHGVGMASLAGLTGAGAATARAAEGGGLARGVLRATSRTSRTSSPTPSPTPRPPTWPRPSGADPPDEIADEVDTFARRSPPPRTSTPTTRRTPSRSPICRRRPGSTRSATASATPATPDPTPRGCPAPAAGRRTGAARRPVPVVRERADGRRSG